MSQQQKNKSILSIPDYQTAFNQRIIPVDLKGHQYVNAHNIKFTDSTERTATDLLLIDSAARNWDTEEPNDYTVYLGEKLEYVHSIELVDGYISNSGYVITEHNNSLYFQETHHQIVTENYYTVRIPIGNYNITNLMNQLKHCMHEESKSDSRYSATFDSLTMKVTIGTDDKIGTGIFNLIFADGIEYIGDRGYMETLVINPVTNKKEIRRVETGNSRRRYASDSIGEIIGFKAVNMKGSLTYTGQMIYNCSFC